MWSKSRSAFYSFFSLSLFFLRRCTVVLEHTKGSSSHVQSIMQLKENRYVFSYFFSLTWFPREKRRNHVKYKIGSDLQGAKQGRIFFLLCRSFRAVLNARCFASNEPIRFYFMFRSKADPNCTLDFQSEAPENKRISLSFDRHADWQWWSGNWSRLPIIDGLQTATTATRRVKLR